MLACPRPADNNALRPAAYVSPYDLACSDKAARRCSAAVIPGVIALKSCAAMSEQAKSYGETYAAGLNALLSAGLGQANIAGGFGSSLARGALGGLFSTT